MTIKKLQRYDYVTAYDNLSCENKVVFTEDDEGLYCSALDVTQLEATNEELVIALENLDECYCEIGYDMTKEDRLKHRRVLASVRAALKSARGE